MVAPRQESRTIQNVKPDHLVFPKAPAACGQQHNHWVSKAGSSTDGSGDSQDQTGLRDDILAKEEGKHNIDKGLKEVAAYKTRAQVRR
jgi:hypothetical protein